MKKSFSVKKGLLLLLAGLLACMVMLSAAAEDKALSNPLDGDYAYVTKLVLLEGQGDFLTGTEPFDFPPDYVQPEKKPAGHDCTAHENLPASDEERAGNDYCPYDKIVRSYDTVLYKLEVSADVYNDGDQSTSFTEARVCFAFVLDATEDKAVFVPGSMSWMDQTPGYEYRIVPFNGRQYLYCSYVMHAKTDADGNMSYALPGTTTLEVAIAVKNMQHGSTITPTFYAWMEGNDVHTDEWTEDRGPYSKVNLDTVCDVHNRSEFVSAVAFPVTVSAKLKMNVALNPMQTAGYWVGDFGTGNKPGTALPAPNYEEGRIVTSMDAHVGITVQLQNDSKAKGLKGLEFPDGEPISFDIKFVPFYTLAAEDRTVPLTGENYDFTPILWSVSRKVGHTGAYVNAATMDGRRINGSYTLVLGKREDVGKSYPYPEMFSCKDSGNWTVVQNGDTLRITISDYKFDTTFPRTIDWNNPTKRTIDEHIGVFSTGMVSWLFPYHNQLDNSETDANYISRMLGVGSYGMNIYAGNLTAGGLTFDLPEASTGSTSGPNPISIPGTDNQMNRSDDSGSISMPLSIPGDYSNVVQFVKPFGFSNEDSWSYGCFNNGRDWAFPGAEMGILTGLWTSYTNGFPDNQVIGYDSFVKLDADVLYPRDALKGSAESRILGLSPKDSAAGQDGQVDFMNAPSLPVGEGNTLRVIYAVKTDGENWDSEQEMRDARTEDDDLLWFDTIPAAEAKGKIVGMLVQYRGLIQNSTTYPTVSLGVNMRGDAPLLSTHMITNTLRVWNQGHLRAINAARPADKQLTAVPMRSASNAGYAVDEATCTQFTEQCVPFYPIYNKLVYNENGSYTGDVSTGYAYGDTVYVMGYQTTVSIDTAGHTAGEPKLVYNLDAGQNIADFCVNPRLELARVTPGTSANVPTTTVTMTVELPAGLEYIPGSLYWGGEYELTKHGKQGNIVAGSTAGLPLALVNGSTVSYNYTDRGNSFPIDIHTTITQNEDGTSFTFVFTGVPLMNNSYDQSALQENLFFSAVIQNSSNNTGTSSWELTEMATIRGREEFRDIKPENGNEATTSISVNQNSAEGLGEKADRLYNEIDAQLGWTITYANNSGSTKSAALLYSQMPSRAGKTYAFDGWTLDAAASGAALEDFTLWYTTDDVTGKDASSYTAADLAKADSIWKKLTLKSVTEGGKTYYVPVDVTPAAGATAWILTGPLGGKMSWEVHQTIQPTGNQPGDTYQSVATFRTNSGDALSAYGTVYVAGREVSGIAWYDANQNGVYDSGETLLSGVTATLQRKDDISYTEQKLDVAGKPMSPVITGADGAYRFPRLPEGSYRVVFSGNVLQQYAGLTAWQVNGVNDDVTSDAVEENGRFITKFSAAAGDIVLHSIDYINQNETLNNFLERVAHQDAGFIKNGSVSLTKQVSGGPLTNGTFTFKAVFTLNGQPLREVTFVYGTASQRLSLYEDGSVPITLPANTTVTFADLPAGAAFSFTEVNPGTGYTATWVDGKSSGIIGETAAVTCVNKFTPATFTPQAKKTILSEQPLPDVPTFTFTLTASPSNPAGGASLTGTASATVQGEGTVSFDAITFSKVGTYTFAITEENTGAPGYTYDPSEWLLAVVVSDEDGQLAVSSWAYANGDETAEPATFINSYTAEDAVYTPVVTKKIEGPKPEAPETYTFALTAGSEFGMTLPEIREVTVTSAGTASFGEIAFHQAGTYTLTITELPGEDPACTYDAAPVTLKITVADRGGQLYVVSAVCTKNGATVKTAEFTNVYETPEVPVTGDRFSALYLPLLLLTGLALLAMKKKLA